MLCLSTNFLVIFSVFGLFFSVKKVLSSNSERCKTIPVTNTSLLVVDLLETLFDRMEYAVSVLSCKDWQ